MFSNLTKDYEQELLSQLASRPPFRRLRAYAFDPSLSLRLETASINHTVFHIPWERDLKPGPRGEYIEVIDYDPASDCWYEPVDLNTVNLLAQDGLAPSQGNPQYHQQMVYAVAMNTISNFERALGRQVLWSSRVTARPTHESEGQEEYVRTLRLYPHAIRAPNAYYSPQKKAILFGYFQGPSGTVFSCLSQDIIAHEVTHALLDGMHRRYVEDNHVDTLAFHEAFADLVALFQHFTFPEVLKHQIERTGGNLETQSLLGELAQEFGEATGRYGALRNAIGEMGADGAWRLVEPSAKRLQEAIEPHERGSILVATVFSAFLAIYKARTKNIFELANLNPGTVPSQTMHPTLITALADEATKVAKHFLNMCIRALDYCPPFDITFGDYLRALVTADYDMVANDKHGYRVALIESFRRWGIVPDGLKTLSEEQLRWPYARAQYEQLRFPLERVCSKLKGLLSDALFSQDRGQVFMMLKDARATTHQHLRTALMGLEGDADRNAFMTVTGLNMTPNGEVQGLRYKSSGLPSFEVHAVVPTLRVTPDGQILKQIILSVTQRLRDVPVDPDDEHSETFDFRGGSTLIFDMEGEMPSLRYAITRSIDDKRRLEAIRTYKRSCKEAGHAMKNMYFSARSNMQKQEPFCFLHGG